jgi:hypothetical protein
MNRLICAILLLLMIAPSAAQDAAPFPVLDEAAIFADGVTVIERLPIINLDYTTHEIHSYHPANNEWRSYPFPENVEFLISQRQGDGTYLLATYSDDTAWLPYIADKQTWIFSPENGTFNAVESVCNLARALPPDTGAWYFTKIDNEYHLCHNGTGQLSPSFHFPRFNESNDCLIGRAIGNHAIDSSGTWLIFHSSCYNGDPYRIQAIFIFAYNIQTNEIFQLGIADYTRYIAFAWRENGIGVLKTTIKSATGYDEVLDAPFVQDRAAIYTITIIDNRPVMQHILEARSNSLSWSDDSIAWLEQDESVSQIFEYDLATEQTEHITDLDCASRRCFVYWHDENTIGVSGSMTDFPPVEPLYIYDKHNDEWVYENRAMILQSYDDSVLIYSSEMESAGVYLQSINLNSFEVTPHGTASIGVYTDYPPIHHPSYIIVRNWEKNVSLGIYDVETDTTYPLLLVEEDPRYYRVEWQDDSSLIITRAIGDYFGAIIGRWHIRINALDEDNS